MYRGYSVVILKFKQIKVGENKGKLGRGELITSRVEKTEKSGGGEN